MRSNKRKYLFFRIAPAPVYLFFILQVISCTQKNFPTRTEPIFAGTFAKPDYSDLDSWASHPWKKDPADSIPAGVKNKNKDSVADVFFVYPTTYTEETMPMGWNADAEDKILNRKTDYTTILFQASVFNGQCRIFAPRYRQANIYAFFTTDTASAEKAFDTAYADVKNAFEYYLKNYNNGRPIIIAAHSQGTLHAGSLLKEFFENKPLNNKLVCAYIIGLPVFTSYFKELQPCRDSTSTDCFVSWRTFKEGYIPAYVQNEKEKVYVINPLTWTMDENPASASLNKGGILKKFNTMVPGVVSAQVHGNILWTSLPKFFGNIFLATKNYHIGDINLFYMNIRENIRTRISSYLKNVNAK